MSGVYIHIPFCKQACSYCDFYFVTRLDQRERFIEKLVGEITSLRDSRFTEEPVKTVYFGGGTPSLLTPREIEKVMNALHDTFRLNLTEVTLEANPDDINRPGLKDMRDLGINRLSMGIQSFDPDRLNMMNRAHSRGQALESLELLASIGFEAYSVDLIYGNPGQSLHDLEKDLDTVTGFDPPHISAYSLTVEPKTRLGRQVETGRIQPPGDEEVAAHFDLVVEGLKQADIRQYEVSNFSKPGHEAVHNSNYWRHENYLGFGPAAHSFWWEKEAMRWENRADLNAYISESEESRPPKELLSETQLVEERLMMGLRTRDGISPGEMKKRYGYELNERQQSYLAEREKEGKIEMDGRSFRLTQQGLKIADMLILDIITLG